MEKTLSVFTVFLFLFFAVTTPRLSSDPVLTEPSTESDSNVIILLNEKSKLVLDETLGVNKVDQMASLSSIPTKHQIYKKVTLNPLVLGRRLFKMFGKKVMVPQTKILSGKNVILYGKIYSLDVQTFKNDQVPTSWVEIKHGGDMRVAIFG